MTDNKANPEISRPARVLCVGAAVLDTLFRVERLPSGQGKILPYEMLHIAEGMAASAAFAIAQLGGEPTLWCAVGDDDAGSRIVRDLAGAGIDMTGATTVPGARSAAATILIDDDGERLIIPFYDQLLRSGLKSFFDDDVAAFDAVLVDVRWPAMAKQVLEAAQRVGIPAILDADVAPPGTVDILAPVASHIIFSQPASALVSGVNDPEAAVQILAQKFPKAFVSVTVGELGCYWINREQQRIEHMGALTIKAVDTLAAGDVFHGAFAVFIAEGKSVPLVLKLSSVAAALKCEVFGGRTGAPDRESVFTIVSRDQTL